VISTTEWYTIESVCFEGVETLSTFEQNLITAFGIISYLLLSIVVISKIILSATEDEDNRHPTCLTKCSLVFDEFSILGSRVWRLLCSIVSLILIIQFWAFFRFRRLQSDMIGAAGGSFPDEKWTFGQIVAVVTFIPVVVEVGFLWSRRSLYHA
jgi:hypothetical protein